MANFNFNKVILGGRLTADPELKSTGNGVFVTSFAMAVNRRFINKNDGQQLADFINCTAWRLTAEFIAKHFKKGDAICIVGSIQTRSWTDQQGAKRYATEVVAEEAFFVDSKNTANASAAPASYMPEAYTSGSLAEASVDEDLPF